MENVEKLLETAQKGITEMLQKLTQNRGIVSIESEQYSKHLTITVDRFLCRDEDVNDLYDFLHSQNDFGYTVHLV